MAIAAKDRYAWAVIMIDDRYVGEYDRPEGRGFAEVNVGQVKQIKLEPRDAFLLPHYVEVPSSAEAVFFRRRQTEISLTQGMIMPRETTHCIGWRHGEQGVYLFVMDDGSTLLSSDLQAV